LYLEARGCELSFAVLIRVAASDFGFAIVDFRSIVNSFQNPNSKI